MAMDWTTRRSSLPRRHLPAGAGPSVRISFIKARLASFLSACSAVLTVILNSSPAIGRYRTMSSPISRFCAWRRRYDARHPGPAAANDAGADLVCGRMRRKRRAKEVASDDGAFERSVNRWTGLRTRISLFRFIRRSGSAKQLGYRTTEKVSKQ